MDTSAPSTTTEGVRHSVRLAAILNVASFGVEFAVALAIGSVSLFADSIDFLLREWYVPHFQQKCGGFPANSDSSGLYMSVTFR